jgi:chemotaxis protein histidine kinase CheA
MADPDDRLDKVLSHLDSIHKMCDSLNTRMDAVEGERAKEKADAQARADAEAKEKGERDEKEKADKARMDAEAKEKDEKEKADKARADAEAKEKEEKEKADAALAAAARSDSAVAKRLAEIERRIPATLSDEDKPKFADAQMRADAAYQAWGYGQAPGALGGETLSDYRVRLLGKLKPHSKAFKDSNLSVIAGADASAFSSVEGTIIADAVEASSKIVTIGAPLRKSVTRNESGHTITKFSGDPAVTWSPFMGGATKFGRINREMANRH